MLPVKPIQTSFLTPAEALDRINSLPLEYRPNEEQLAYITKPLSSFSVIALPGSGKTTTTVNKVIFHALTGELNKNNFRLISYTNSAKSELIANGIQQLKLLKESCYDVFNTTTCSTVDRLGINIAEKAYGPLQNKLQGIKNALAFLTDKTHTEERKRKLLEEVSYKVIFLDEAQDTQDTYYDMLKAYCELVGCSLIMIGDANQKIYFKCDLDLMYKHSPKDILIFKQNYRSSQAIINVANHMLPNIDFLQRTKMVSAKPQSQQQERPPIFIDPELNKTLRQVLKWLREDNGKRCKGTVALLVPEKKIAKDICTFLELQDISLSYQRYCSFTSDDVLEEEQTGKRKRTGKGPITFQGSNQLIPNVEIDLKIYSIHGSKGLGFDTVVLVGFHYNPWNSIVDFYDSAKYAFYERLFFVAVTRAKSYLSFTAWNHVSQPEVNYKLWTAIDTLGSLVEVKHTMDQDNFDKLFRTGPAGGLCFSYKSYNLRKRKATFKPQIRL